MFGFEIHHDDTKPFKTYETFKFAASSIQLATFKTTKSSRKTHQKGTK